MDKLITPGAQKHKNRLRRHCFAPLDAAAPPPGPPLSPRDSQTFKSGLFAPSGIRRPVKEAAVAAQDPGTPACIWEQFRTAVDKLETEQNQTFEQAAEETMRLFRAISQKMLDSHLGIDPEKTRALVDEAWQNIQQAHIVHLRISPRDLTALKQAGPDALCREDTKTGYVFHEDASLETGAFLVEGPRLDTQSSLLEQLALIKRNFSACCLKQTGSGHPVKAANGPKPGIPYKGRP